MGRMRWDGRRWVLQSGFQFDEMMVSQEKKLEQSSIERIPNVAEGVGGLAVVVDKDGIGKEGGAETAAPTPKRKRGKPPKLQAVIPAAGNDENEGVGPPEMEGGQRSASSVTKPLEQAAAENDTSSAVRVPVPVMETKVADERVQLQEGKKYSSMKGKRGKRRTISINTTTEEDSREKADEDDNDDSQTRNQSVLADDQPWLVQSPSVDGREGTVPFKIRTPTFWKTIESMEALRKLPQRPHFRPLEGINESGREALAIGKMVTFSTVVDTTFALRSQDPRITIEELLETLAELETHGFEVEVIRDRLTRLLLIKDKQEELRQQSYGMTQKLEEARMEGDRADAEVAELDREIMELEEKRRQLLSSKEKHMGDSNAVCDCIHQQLTQVGLEFDGLATATIF